MPLPPLDTDTTMDALIRDPYPIYKRMRAQSPVTRVDAVKRTMLTKASDTRFVKDNAAIFSSDDPNTPMQRAFRAHTLMRKDGAEHQAERMAMAPAFAPQAIKTHWVPTYTQLADQYLDRLKPGDQVDLFTSLAGPYSAAGLAVLLGLPDASDEQMQYWSDTLITGAGNFAWREDLFAQTDRANDEMDAEMARMAKIHRIEKGPSAFAVMLNADTPIAYSQMLSNIKIAIGGGINEPRDSLLTAIAGLLQNPDQLDQVIQNGLWNDAFEEAIRWVAPIQVSSRLVTQDVEIRGCDIPKGDTVMTIQASACHDEDLYDNGHLFDVFRTKAPHQAFGNGPHFCQGTHVARRAVAAIMLPKFFERFPKTRLVAPVEFTGFGFRGPRALQVVLG